MALFINPLFWVIAIAVYLLLLLRLPGRLAFRFGLFNLLALTVLLGWKISLGAIGFVLLIWSSLNLLKILKNKPSLSGRSLICLGFFTILFVLFLLHKLNLADSEFSIQLSAYFP